MTKRKTRPRKPAPFPATPTLDKMLAVKARSQAIGEFLEWLRAQGIVLHRLHEHDDSCLDEDGDPLECGLVEGDLVPDYRSIEKLLADFFEIDLVQVENERVALLNWQRAQNG